METLVVEGVLGTSLSLPPSLPLQVSPHGPASSGPASGGQGCECRVSPTTPAFPALGSEVSQHGPGLPWTPVWGAPSSAEPVT